MQNKTNKNKQIHDKLVNFHCSKILVYFILSLLVMGVSVYVTKNYFNSSQTMQQIGIVVSIAFGFTFTGLTIFLKFVESAFDFRKYLIEHERDSQQNPSETASSEPPTTNSIDISKNINELQKETDDNVKQDDLS